MRKAINELEKIITADKKLKPENILEKEPTRKDFSKNNDDRFEGDGKSKMLEGWEVTQTDRGEIYSTVVEVKPHHQVSKEGKVYTYGRIQLTKIDPSWVGLKAKVIVTKEDT